MTTTAAASSSTPTIQELNVGTSLDVSSIVSGLMQVQDIPLTELENQVTTEQAEVSAYGSLSSALSTFQSVVANAADSANFQTLTASVGSTSAASAAISTSTGTGAATQGSHSLSISQLAQNQLIASGDFSSTTAAVGTGTLTIQYGSYASNGSFTPSTTQASTSVTIGSGNSTVSGVVSAINSAAGGVTASVVNDGTGSRIVLSGNNTGASNGFRVVVSDSDGDNDDSSGLSALAYDPTDTSNTSGSALLQSSQDAKLSVDNIAVTSASNTVTNAVQGVTLSLTGTTTSATTLTVGSSASQASGVVEGFVNGYNTLVSAITSLTSYDATTNQASALTGDTSTQIISENLQSAAAATFNTGDPNYTDLADLGITFQADGTLALNSSKLSAALAADPNAVQQIFSTTGSATDSSVSYNSATSDTKAGTYALNVTQLATQGTLTGSAAAGLTITAGSNDTFSLDLDSTTAEITVPAGTYTAATLASAVQNAINTNSTISKAGLSVNVSNNNGVLTVTPSNYGSGSSATVDASAGAVNLFGSSSTSTAGLDVAGTINGDQLIGNGQSATGAIGTPEAGLNITIRGGSTGARGSISYSQGIGSQMDNLITGYLDPTNGLIVSATNGIQATITNLSDQETQLNARLAVVQANLEAEFTTMSELLAKMQSTSAYLEAQLGVAANTETSATGAANSSSSSNTTSSSGSSSGTSST
jgi:flagellar hook-associated protein 2